MAQRFMAALAQERTAHLIYSGDPDEVVQAMVHFLVTP